MHYPPPFSARVVRGSGRGTPLGFPTLNLDLAGVPEGLPYGEYACRARLGDGPESAWLPATAHHGPSPVFDQPVSFEVHVLDREVSEAPATVGVELVEWLREVKNFPSVEALRSAISEDIRHSRAILAHP